MKSIFIAGISIIIVISLVFILGFTTIGGKDRTVEDWGISGQPVNCSWGTSIQVTYEDSSTEILNSARPLFEVSFREQKVSSFEYILSAKGTSEEHNAIEIYLSGFDVIVSIEGEDGDWVSNETTVDIATVNMDDEWTDVYRVKVKASSLDGLVVGRTYTLMFTPSGSMTYCAPSMGVAEYVPLPSWFSVTFNVNSESSGGNGGNETGDDDDDDGDYWIEIETTSSETGD